MKRLSVLLIAVMFLVVFSYGLVYADENDTNNSGSGNNDTNDSNSGSGNNDVNDSNNETNDDDNETVECTEDNECGEGKECEDGVCVIEEEDEDDDDNETDDDLNDNETEENKVCCKMLREREEFRLGDDDIRYRFETEVRYRFVEESDCSIDDEEEEDNEVVTREVVDDAICIEQREEFKLAIRERNIIRFENRTGQECTDGCNCRGVVMTCELGDGTTEMTVFAGESGNIIIKIRGVNMTTNVTLYHHDGRIFGNFSNETSNETREVRVLPDEAKERVRERLRSRFIDEETEIELEENGIYKFKAMKKARLFFIIPVGETVEADIDAETGQFFKLDKGPWWGFLANDESE